MIRLRKLNQEEFLINEDQIEAIKLIPETKIIMMNNEFYIVAESADEVVDKIIEFRRKVAIQPKPYGGESDKAAMEE